MYKIVVANQCGCFKNSDLKNNLIFNSKDEALTKALEMKDVMNNDFCKKHTFEVQEMYTTLLLHFILNKEIHAVEMDVVFKQYPFYILGISIKSLPFSFIRPANSSASLPYPKK